MQTLRKLEEKTGSESNASLHVKMVHNDLDNRIAALENKCDKIIELLQAVATSQQSTSPTSDCEYTFGDWLVKWFDTYKKPKLKDSTLQSLSDMIHKRIMPSKLSSKPLGKITGLELQDFLAEITAKNTRKKIKIYINAAFDKACRLRLIIYNPCLAVEIPGYKQRHYRPLEYAEQNKLIYYYEHPTEFYNYTVTVPVYYALFRVMCCTGMRIGEATALTYAGDVDRCRRIITVNKTKSRHTGEVFDGAKTEMSIREIPFLPSLQPYLDILREHIQKGGQLTYNGVAGHFRKIYRRLKIKGANLHTFRHTFISMCYAAGMREKLIQTIAGHADMTTTMNIYTHILKPGTSMLFEYIQELQKVTRLDRKR